MTDFYLCDFASIITKNYPKVIVNFLGIDPDKEQVDVFFDLLDSAVDTQSGPFVIIADDSLTLNIGEATRELVNSGIKAFGQKFKSRFMALISVVPSGSQKSFQRGFFERLFSRPPFKEVSSLTEAEKMASGYMAP